MGNRNIYLLSNCYLSSSYVDILAAIYEGWTMLLLILLLLSMNRKGGREEGIALSLPYSGKEGGKIKV